MDNFSGDFVGLVRAGLDRLGLKGHQKERLAYAHSAGLLVHPILRSRKGLGLLFPPQDKPEDADVQVGWGRKPSGERAVRKAQETGSGLLLVEDGFIRSADRDDVPISMVEDDCGIYYDANTRSRLEGLCQIPLTKGRAKRARNLREMWCAERVSKYNSGREISFNLPHRYVLVVDQVRGDCSVKFGGANENSFKRMLEAALSENPGCTVIVKTHPDKSTRGKLGHFDIEELSQNPRIQEISDPCHPVRLIQNASKVYTVTSQMGFEALMHGRTVRCFGMPFYAGWGLTQDELQAPKRRSSIKLEALIHAALVDYPFYMDPVTGEEMKPEDAIAYMGGVRRMVEKTPQTLYAVGFSLWKRQILKRFCRYSEIVFCEKENVPAGATVALWGLSDQAGLPDDVNVIRIEDGFMRSRGLGADLTQPYSWCLDREGIHFDPSRSSEVENLLSSGEIPQFYLKRAKNLRRKIAANRISKYNLPGDPWQRPRARRVVLVAGQVEDDASVLAGSPVVRRNVDLLRRAREMEPKAWLVYKPHPDVVSGLRQADADPAMISELADEIVENVSILDLLDKVDAVHVMTSQVGFEAIIKGISVVCHGNPFYSGWGLTDDCLPPSGRRRSCSIDELVAASLILYPAYSDPKSGLPLTPEQTVDLLTRCPGRARGRVLVRGLRKIRKRLRRERDKAQHDEHEQNRPSA